MKLWDARILIRILLLLLLIHGSIWLFPAVRIQLRQSLQGTPGLGPGPGPGPGPGAVELPDGTFTFRLDPAAFRAEFPQLQSYRCRELIPGDGVCTGPPGPPLLLLAVKSHPASSARRATARRTWARPGVLGGYRVRAVFLVGVSPNPRHMVLLEEESQEFGDVVLWDIGESHHNLSLKERCFLRWVGARCGQADFIFKGDDDVFVNPPAMVAFLRQMPSASDLLHGNVQRHARVMRGGKYRMATALFPQDTYPHFPSGGGFLMPRASVPALAAASERIPVFPLDDVYLGFLALAAGLGYRHDPRFRVFGMKDELCLYGEAFVVHGVSLGRVEEVWRGLYTERRCNGMGPLPS
ncbi:UDP-GlcNAc:betaGal beta-1,3-N-acetylglucosaminyltransferase 9-like [Mauremys reevesii]|uniref:UDP-GlcNAc:betaGal beta-1,3-N-acetylglucosaminyltransferase 9-like n=1 Tax=Mauremys reevesii TaxID=260615 RepID=UPI00193F030E|nr:UDP-GlcNAc:betaGal beta-1,3-N-acetylglucosaminyltransferase 9-like [Mauremys reevesii]